MVSVALVSLLVAGAIGPGSLQTQPVSLRGAPRSARLLAPTERLVVAQAAEASRVRLAELDSRIAFLELSKPEGPPLAGLVIGSVLAIAGLAVTTVGIVLLALPASAPAAALLLISGVLTLVLGVPLLIAGVVLVAFGAQAVSGHRARVEAFERELESLRRERQQLALPPGEPRAALPGPAPALTLAAF